MDRCHPSICLLLCLYLLHSFAACQESPVDQKKYFLAGARLNYGLVIAHTQSIVKAANSNPIGIQADFSWHFNTRKAYDFCNCLPRLGVSAYFWDYRNNDILGHSFSVIAFAEPFFNLYRRFKFSLRPGFGLAYMTNPYDSLSNPDNLAYSTHIGYSLLLNVTAYYSISDRLLINLAVNYNHVSNGGVKIPNKGLNYPTLSLGLDYSLLPMQFNRFQATGSGRFNRKNRIILATLIGFKGLLIDDKTYSIFGLYSKYLFHLGRNSYLAEGIEFNIDQTKIKLSEVYEGTDPNDRYILSLSSGYEHTLGKFSLTFDLGLYLRNPDRAKDVLYQRYGAKIHIFKGFFAGINLKAHRHYAEFFDIRMGVRL